VSIGAASFGLIQKSPSAQIFVSKNADAFEIVGYHSDAIPEYPATSEWRDLETDECCPFCDCLCCMHFQDASQMYHCSDATR
jgi:hypothetical protein